MQKLQSYIHGKWVEGSGEGVPLIDAVTGETIALSDTKGLDFDQALKYGRQKGETLRKMTFQERGNMLKKLALHLTKKKKQFYEVSFRTGATKVDSWIDIEGGFGNLFANASLRKIFPNQAFDVEGDPIDLSRGGRFMAHHILVPKEGVAVHINAFNFPVWGMLEKCAVNWMAGMPAVVKPATNTSFLTEAVVREIINSGILPEGSLQLISGSARSILDTVESQDVVTFTGSADTGRMLKSHKRLLEESVPFNMEADSLNASILGEDAKPGTPEFDLFIKEVRNEMTVKCGQKCTAIRRVIVPENLVEDVQIALGKSLGKVTIGDPRLKEVRMGALVSKDQVQEVRERIQEMTKTASIVYGDLEKIQTIGADTSKGAFMSPIVMREDNPYENIAVHSTEAFGPVSTIMPYKNMGEAIELSKMGKGSLVSSIATNDDKIAADYTVNAATHHGRILVINRESAKQSTGHGSPLPLLVHGGPGRAGGGEEMGGKRGIKHYMQRCAIQGSPTTLTEITGIYQPKAKYKQAEKHPFAYHWEDIQPGMSLKTHNRTLTDTDIVNFGNLTWDHFYAHTDITSLEGSIFEKRTAHGYFIISAAAGLFVYPNKGPVAANYGLEEIRFLRPLYHNDTIHVRLTCKEKVDRDQKGTELPSGIVKWYVEVFDTEAVDEEDKLVAIATILTMVQKKQDVFHEIDRSFLEEKLSLLKEDQKPEWGMMMPQHMLEHLEGSFKLGRGLGGDVEIITPEEHLDKVKETLYTYEKMPQGYKHPLMKQNELEPLKHESFDEAKKSFLKAYDDFHQFHQENPDEMISNAVFGELTYFEWKLLNRKHINHHFEQFGLI
ncbi:MAG: phenylacetic acid degradation bifunctional protein PaaZ [Psychroflexus halocasei]|uniref:phenylacetic acid degradation bifunctional protein PaaZ n=1 Tax=Psychroflexus sp. S27 TaxID=1982757 RepID=UPI000C299A53|nr:phenylacetic acid degradation bifunctional protein PaaZ [Psychroflexus sp. S27]PJX22872.1 phenylacetic acid degradation bifunctional protein PaaZ [Psychroflexus sp. S27]